MFITGLIMAFNMNNMAFNQRLNFDYNIDSYTTKFIKKTSSSFLIKKNKFLKENYQISKKSIFDLHFLSACRFLVIL